MKILITSDWYEPVVNGVVTSIRNLANELRLKGHEVRVLTLSYDHRSHYENEVYYIASLNAAMFYPNARATAYVGRDYIDDIVMWKPDIIHSQCELSTFQYAKKIAKYLGIPIVHTYHTLYEDYTHYFVPNKSLGKHMVSRLSRRLLASVQCIIAPSQKIKNVLESYRIMKRICVVPTGIELDKFDVSLGNQERIAILNDYRIPTDKRLLVTVGRLAKEKNVEQLIDYFDETCRDDLDFVIVGGGPYKKVLQNYANQKSKKDRIHFTDMIMPQLIPKMYKLGDIFVCASTSEAQGLTYMEALASGIPSVCRRDDCLNDVIIDGYDGFQYTSQEDFENRINQILDDDELHGKMSENAKELTCCEFSKKAFADKIEEIYISEIERYK